MRATQREQISDSAIQTTQPSLSIRCTKGRSSVHWLYN